jgi:hypothetical protein
MHSTKLPDYRDLIADLRVVEPQAHVAGGAVRDHLLGRRMHDLDIFVPTDRTDDIAARLRKQHGYVPVGSWKEYLGFSDPAMTGVAKFERADSDIPVCVIGLIDAFAAPQANVDRFDFGICMAWYDGENTRADDRFYLDHHDKRFTLCRADNVYQYRYSLSRYNKLTHPVTGRYAGWQLVVPPEFQDLAQSEAVRSVFYFDGPDWITRSKGFPSPAESTLPGPKDRGERRVAR